MSKSIIIQMDNEYPFGKIDTSPSAIPIKVKRKILSSMTKPSPEKLLEKIKYFRGLKHDCLIKIDSVMEEDEDLFVSYEYVPIPIDKWFVGVSREFIENYEQRLILLSRYLVDQGVVTIFKRQNLGLLENGEGKYFLDCLSFSVDHGIDKASFKRKYKEEIKALFQVYIDKKNGVQPKIKEIVKQPEEKKQVNKMLKILETIEKGKANLYGEVDPKQVTSKQSVRVLPPQKSFTQMSKAELKQQFGPQSKKNVMLDLKLNRFEEIKHKEYKSMKTSGQFYVQDFISVLQDVERVNPSSSSDEQVADTRAQTSSNPSATGIHKQNSKNYRVEKDPLNYSQFTDRDLLNLSATNISAAQKNNRSFNHDLGFSKASKDLNSSQLGNSTLELQKKVSEAIANSLNAINKFKKTKS